MNEFLNIAKQRLQEKQSQEEELKMSRLTSIIDQDKNLTKKITKLSQENQSLVEKMNNKSNENSTVTLEKSSHPRVSTSVKTATKPLPTTSSMRKFKSTKPRITKADKKFCEGIYKILIFIYN